MVFIAIYLGFPGGRKYDTSYPQEKPEKVFLHNTNRQDRFICMVSAPVFSDLGGKVKLVLRDLYAQGSTQ